MSRFRSLFALAWKVALGILLSGLVAIALLLLLSSSLAAPEIDVARAENSACQLKSSISSYVAEYRRFPLRSGEEDIDGDSGHALMDILLGSDPSRLDSEANPRGIVFFAGRRALEEPKNVFRRGISFDPADGTGQLWDPWGNLYRYRFDNDGDGRVENPAQPDQRLPDTILVWSAGPDGDYETWEDNVITW